MHTHAQDLPAELIARIAELLSGDMPETLERDSHVCPPLELSKRELGNCALTCRYWAKILRPEIFRKLVLRTAEDGRLLRSFLESPASVDLAIAPLVGYIRIECNLAEQPWVHLVFMLISKLINIDEVHLSVSYPSTASPGSPSRTVRSIHHALPRTLPLRLFRVQTLHLHGLSFADLSSINKFIRSVDRHRPDITLEDIHVEDVKAYSAISPPRSWTGEYATVYVKGGDAPLSVLRAMLSTSPRPTRSQIPPYVQPRVFAALEKVLLLVMRTCPVIREWSSPGRDIRVGDGNTHQHPRELSYAMHEDVSNNTHVKLESWCDGGLIKRVVANIREDGSLRSLHIGVSDCQRAMSISSSGVGEHSSLWSELDAHLWAAAADLQCLDFCVEPLGREALAKVVRENMPRFTQAGKLQFRTFDCHGRLALFEV